MVTIRWLVYLVIFFPCALIKTGVEEVRRSTMKKLGWLTLALAVLVAGCATQPINQSEMFPVRNTDPTVGLIIVEGTASANLIFKDGAGRVIEEWGERGASPALAYNGRGAVRIYLHQLPVGNSTVEVLPFYYRLTPFSGRVRYDLPRQTASVYIGRDPSAYYDAQYTKRHWGWVLYIYTGNIPDYDPGTIGMPRVNVTGTGIIGDLIEALRRR